jgi:hypothetical protein
MANVGSYTRRVNGKLVRVSGYKSSRSKIPQGPGIPTRATDPTGDADSDAFDAVSGGDDHSFEALRPPPLKLKPRDLAPPIAAQPGQFPRGRNIPYQFPKVDNPELVKGPGGAGPGQPGEQPEEASNPDDHAYGDTAAGERAEKPRKRVLPPTK